MPQAKKLCANCGERIDDPRSRNGGWICPHIAGLLDINGPPWENCRFWTKQPKTRKVK